MTREEWIRHRKLRKKIASAKWYAHKKQRELSEQKADRQRLEELITRRQQAYAWPNPTHRAEWYAVVAHLCLGYPVRPSGTDAEQWRRWVERVERELVDLTDSVRGLHPVWDVYMTHTFVRKIFRQLAIRECQQPHAWRHWDVPRGCTHPHLNDRLWTTSIWNWLWVISHLGNHREAFPILWTHLHHHALLHPIPPGGWRDEAFIRHDSHTCSWIHWMSQNLSDYIQDALPPEEVPSQEPEEGWDPYDADPYDASPDAYVTQYDTPDWYSPTDDSDSESLPSSLDHFVTDTFASIPITVVPPASVITDKEIEWPPSASPNSKTAFSNHDEEH